MSKVILKKLGHIQYPVGTDIKGTMIAVKNMADAIKELYPLHENMKYGFNLFVRGSSGAIIGGLICEYLSNYPIRICHIKKEGESSHFNSSYLTNREAAKNIIIDDFISTGETVNIIYQKMIDSEINNVDLLIVSGTIYESYLQFKPLNIICEDYYPSDKSMNYIDQTETMLEIPL